MREAAGCSICDLLIHCAHHMDSGSRSWGHPSRHHRSQKSKETKLQPHSTCLGQGLPKALKKGRVATILGGQRPHFCSMFLDWCWHTLQTDISCIVTLHGWCVAFPHLQPSWSLNSAWPCVLQGHQAQAQESLSTGVFEDLQKTLGSL